MRNGIKNFTPFLLMLLASTMSFADMTAYAKQYLEKISKAGSPVFFSTCQVDSRHAYLVFGGAKKDPVLIEAVDGIVVNMADISYKDGKLFLEETNGGVASYDRTQKLIDQLSGSTFLLLDPKTTGKLLNRRPEKACATN